MRAIDADKLYFAQRYARVDPDSDRLTPVLAVDKYQIENAPTLDVAPVVHGRWETGMKPSGECYICSECGVEAISHNLDDDTVAYYMTRCCPNCGARMDGE